MKRTTILTIVMLFVPMVLFAQNWTFEKVFPDSANADRDIHGVAVDPDGKIWSLPYYPFGGDSVSVPELGGDSARVSVITVYNPDGSEVDFSPIKILEFGDGTKDTLGGTWTGETFTWNSGRGINTLPNGNIVVAFFTELFVIDYETGAGLAYAQTTDNGIDDRGITKPAVDASGNIYVSGVFPGDPIAIYNSDLEFQSNAIDETVGFSRAFAVNPDGSEIWWSGYTNGAIFRYTRPDAFSPFGATPDTVLKGMSAESFDIHPITNYLWVSAGSPNDLPNTFVGTPSPSGYVYTQQTWYAFDYATLGTQAEVPMDSLTWNKEGSGPLEGRPRAIDFSPDGKTVYVGQFNQGAYGLQSHTTDQDFTSNEDDLFADAPKGYKLSQNYPNPFNPTTNIEFTLKEAGFVSLKVYDMTGRLVSTIVNKRMNAGSHSEMFNASNLASGVYIYTLEANGVRLTNKMTLIK